MEYAFNSPNFSYSLKCSECRAEKEHTTAVHHAIIGKTNYKWTAQPQTVGAQVSNELAHRNAAADLAEQLRNDKRGAK